jgi:hypothetical protein
MTVVGIVTTLALWPLVYVAEVIESKPAGDAGGE